MTPSDASAWPAGCSRSSARNIASNVGDRASAACAPAGPPGSACDAATRAAAVSAAACSPADDRQQRLAAQRRAIGAPRARRPGSRARSSKPCVMTSMLEFTTASPSLPNFFTYCLWTTSRNCSWRDAEFLQQRRDREERAEERVALHAQLQVAAVGRLRARSRSRAA